MLTRAAKLTWLVVGCLALALGALGIALPLLPTTPLVLVAAFAFARSSERLHQWLINHEIFGALIDNWRGVGLLRSLLLVAAVPAQVIGIQAAVLGATALFILTRPLPPGT